MKQRLLAAASFGLAAAIVPSVAVAAPAGAARVAAPAGGGQAPLTVEVSSAAGSFAITACAKASCAPTDFKAVAFPSPPPADADPARAQLTVLAIGQLRNIVRVELTEPGKAWTGLIAAPINGAAEPVALWSGRTGEPMGGD